MFSKLTERGQLQLKERGRLRGTLFRAAVLCSLLLGLMAMQAVAQRAPGVPASVTSQNFGGHVNHAPGIPATVTGFGSIGPHNNNRGPFLSRPEHGRDGDRDHRRRDRDQGGFIYGFPPYYYGGYYDNYGPAPEGSAPDGYAQDQYNGGPTIFDRRGNGDYNAPAPDNARSRNQRDDQEQATIASATQPEPPPASNQPETVLVFKDGHKAEVQNYAIVGNTLYDFSDGGRKKISMAELDLPATAKQNDERGVDFAVPGGKVK